MRTPILGGALAMVCAVGCSGFDSSRNADPALGVSTSAIQGGTDDTDHNFAVGIVLVQDTGAIALCSGVLLAPNLVATARHCVSRLTSSVIDCATSTFTETFPASDLFVTQQPTLPMQANAVGYVRVASNGIFVPTGNGVCGNDIALLVLDTNLTVPEYVTPTIAPPMTDHHVYTTAYTAIGYGIDSPTDTQGATAGVRRIRQNINLDCIPNDSGFVDCFSFAGASQFIDAKEFEGGDGTCEGDSGSGAYDQGSFNGGNWVAFGVLSRGGVSNEGGTCLGAVYTRFDAWSSLLTQAATQASQMGNYPLPAWAGGATSCQANAGACSADTDCCSVNCETLDNGATFSCVACDGTDHPCSSGYGCRSDGVCVLGLRSTVAGAPDTAVDGGAGGSGSHSGGCAIAATGVEGHVGWGAWPAALGLAFGAFHRRRRARAAARAARNEA